MTPLAQLKSAEISVKVQKILEQEESEKRRIDEQMHEVSVLLENLFEREQATFISIVDRLYDMGSTNFINRKVRPRILKRFMKAIAKTPKPLVRWYAMGRLKRDAPRLIARWLRSKVSF